MNSQLEAVVLELPRDTPPPGEELIDAPGDSQTNTTATIEEYPRNLRQEILDRLCIDLADDAVTYTPRNGETRKETRVYRGDDE